MGLQEELKTLPEKIRQYRDEARVQLHLARQDVKDEFDNLEQEWDRFKGKCDQTLDDATEVSTEALLTVQIMGEDLKKGYQNIRDKIK
ncbi:hypothetical protein [Marinobacter psychrophilus]|jgi:hypothetical protein|uniref:hypothetical protein n=1 Tax=Marinobacter psychrophilus TaxID=330734 RepID=UPI001B563CF9|nr:hypothetical protein [Marinobacter psychrophilus]MBQ0763452.1 hypothetical protein [Marinobacter psychrophilus]MBQ0845489.1 hypothetical protein [Marinobacter psychrophilus]